MYEAQKGFFCPLLFKLFQLNITYRYYYVFNFNKVSKTDRTVFSNATYCRPQVLHHNSLVLSRRCQHQTNSEQEDLPRYAHRQCAT